MISISTSSFLGEAKEIKFHTLVCFDASFAQQAAIANEAELLSKYNIHRDESYNLVDWWTVETIHRAFPEIPVVNHVLNDRFRDAYDDYLYGQEFRLRDIINNVIMGKQPIKLLKVFPLNERSLIAVGI